jgi:hypothetical protein
MQIGDSLINFFKTLAPKIQIEAVKLNKRKNLHLLPMTLFSFAIIVITLTFNIWMSFLKPELLPEHLKFVSW